MSADGSDAWILVAGAPWWGPGVLFAAMVVLDGWRIGLVAVLACRFTRMFPHWNKACREVEGRSGVALLLSNSGRGGSANPSWLLMGLLVPLVCAFMVFFSWVGKEPGSAMLRMLSLSPMWLALAVLLNVFLICFFTVLPFYAVSRSISDQSAPIIVAMLASWGASKEEGDARHEAEILKRVVNMPVAAPSRSRRL